MALAKGNTSVLLAAAHLVCVLAAAWVAAAVAAPAASAAPTGAQVVLLQPATATQSVMLVQSPALGRVVKVQVLHPAGTAPRPSFYLLDGNQAGQTESMWLVQTDVVDFAAGKNMNVVMVVGGEGSFYTDWQRTDPKLGVNQWETFLTQELPPLVDAHFHGNGRNAIGGLSMGGQAALTLTARNPHLYAGVAAYSACPIVSWAPHQQATSISVRYMGGDPANMWGPATGPMWADHDPAVRKEGLRGKAIYLYAGSGLPGALDAGPVTGVDDSRSAATIPLEAGIPLEAYTRLCAEEFAAHLRFAGIPATTDFRPTGTHSWPYWQEALHASWPTLRAALGL